VKKPLPDYPASSLSLKVTGVAVASVTSGVDGRMSNVTMLEAPDEAIGASVRSALMTWEIPPTTVLGESEPRGIRSKVTFYFRIVKGRGVVFNPEDLPGGPKPEPLAGPPTAPPGARGAGGPPSAPAVVTHHGSPATEIGDAELANLASARPIMLDVRERADFKRGHRDGAVNIPADELNVRAWIELDRSRPVVIDCSQTATARCQIAARRLVGGPKPARVLIYLP
jgi:hypothetical protein